MSTLAFALLTIAAVSQDKAQKVDPFKQPQFEILRDNPSNEVLVTIDQFDPKAWRTGLKKQSPISINSITSARMFENADAVWLEDESTITIIVEAAFLRRQPIFHDLLLAEEVQNLFAKDPSAVFKLSLVNKDRISLLIKNSILAREPGLGVAGDLNTAGKVWISPKLQGSLTIGNTELRVNHDGALGQPGAPEAFRSTFVDEVIRKRIEDNRHKPIVVSSPTFGNSLNLINTAGRTAVKMERRLWSLAGYDSDESLKLTRRPASPNPIPFQQLDRWKQSTLRSFVQAKFKDFGFTTAEDGLAALEEGRFKESFAGFAMRFQTDADRQYLQSPIQIAFQLPVSNPEVGSGAKQ